MKKRSALMAGLVVFIVAGLISLSESRAATIKGKIVSNRIGQFDNFVVYIKNVDPKHFKIPEEIVTSFQKNNQFYPKVLPMIAKRKVLFVNNDVSMHNVHAANGSSVSFNYGIPPSAAAGPISFPKEGETILLCNIHPQMRGYILALQNPFFTKVDGDGYFTINNVPLGKYELETWHNEFISKEQTVTIENEQNTRLIRFTY